LTMDAEKQRAYLKSWKFKDKNSFAECIGRQIDGLEFVALRLFYLFRDQVDQWQRDILQGNPRRFVAEAITPPGNSLLKSSERIAEKIFDSWHRHDQWNIQPREKRPEDPPTRHDPRRFLDTMTDVVRFRILCNYLGDIYQIKSRIEHWEKQGGPFQIKGCDDHIATPYDRRRAGHRAVQFACRYTGDDIPCCFEVQVMTQLQHAWDKKDHHLIYERVRSGQGHRIPVHLKNRMAAMSEMLYVADTAFDELKRLIDQEIAKETP